MLKMLSEIGKLGNSFKHYKGKSMTPIGETTFRFVGVVKLLFACKPTYLAQNFLVPINGIVEDYRIQYDKKF